LKAKSDSAYETDESAKLVLEIGEGHRYGIAPRSAHYLIAVRESGPFGWTMFAVRSGVELSIWNEHPSRWPNPHSGVVDDETPFYPHCLLEAICSAAEVYSACAEAGVPLDSTDPAMVREALSRFDLYINSNAGVKWRAHRDRMPPIKRRRRTQKRLDGGEDMTV
jgi:hypothetical protein